MDGNADGQGGKYKLPSIKSLTGGSPPTRPSDEQEQQVRHQHQNQQQHQQQYMAPQHVSHDSSRYYSSQQTSSSGSTQYGYYHYSSVSSQQQAQSQTQIQDGRHYPISAGQYRQQQDLSPRYINEHRHSFDDAKQHPPPPLANTEHYHGGYPPPQSPSHPLYQSYSPGQQYRPNYSSSGQTYRAPLVTTPHGAPATAPATTPSYYSQHQHGHSYPRQNYQHQQTIPHNPLSSHYAQAHPPSAYTSNAPPAAKQSQTSLRDDAYPAAAMQPHLPAANSAHHGNSPHSPYHPQAYPPQHPGMSRVGSASVISPTTRIGNSIEHMSIGLQTEPPPAPLPPQSHGPPETAAEAASMDSSRDEGSAAPLQKHLPHASITNTVAAVSQARSQSGADKTDNNNNNSDSSDDEDNNDDDNEEEVDDALMKRRKRNAQSAARLRERRKNREQELAQSCTVLMTQISQLETELEEEKRRAMVDMRNNSEASVSTTTGTATPLVATDHRSGSLLNAAVAGSSSKGLNKRQLAVTNDDDVAMQGGDPDGGSTANASTAEDGGPRKRSRPLRELDRARLGDLKIKIESLGKLNQHVCVNLGILRQEILRISQAVVTQQKDKV